MQQISDSRLREAIIRFHHNEVLKLEEEAARNPHHFSLRFQLRMKFLLWKTRIKNVFKKTVQDTKHTGPAPIDKYIPMRKIGIVFLAILLAIVGLGTVVIAVQNAYKLIEKVFPKYSEIRYENPVSQEHTEFVLYEITELPEGFEKDEDTSYHDVVLGKAVTFYWNKDDFILLEQDHADELLKRLNTENIILAEMSIDGKEGYYFSNQGVSTFLWTEERKFTTVLEWIITVREVLIQSFPNSKN